MRKGTAGRTGEGTVGRVETADDFNAAINEIVEGIQSKRLSAREANTMIAGLRLMLQLALGQARYDVPTQLIGNHKRARKVA